MLVNLLILWLGDSRLPDTHASASPVLSVYLGNLSVLGKSIHVVSLLWPSSSYECSLCSTSGDFTCFCTCRFAGIAPSVGENPRMRKARQLQTVQAMSDASDMKSIHHCKHQNVQHAQVDNTNCWRCGAGIPTFICSGVLYNINLNDFYPVVWQLVRVLVCRPS